MSILKLIYISGIAITLGCNAPTVIERSGSQSGEGSGGDEGKSGSDSASGDATPGTPSSFSVSNESYGKATLTWSEPGADTTKQEVLFFGNGNACSGTPDQVVEVAVDATGLDWKRFEGVVVGLVHFMTRTTNAAGETATSACSSTGIRNYAYRIPGPADNSALAVDDYQDINGDGYDDVIFANSSWNSNTGYVAVQLGGPQFTSNPLLVYSGSQADDYVGNDILYADINQDGIKDMIMASEDADPNAVTNAGSLYVILGASNMPNSGVIGTQVGYRYDGTSADAVGWRSWVTYYAVDDFNNDGKTDLAVGDSDYDAPGPITAAGRVQVYQFPATLPASGNVSALNPLSYYGEVASDKVGANLKAFDFDGDGRKEIFSLERSADNGASNTGSLYVVLGTLPTGGAISTAGRRYDGSVSSMRLRVSLEEKVDTYEPAGWGVSADFNGDGILDFAAADYSAGVGGEIYVLESGSLPASGTVDARWITYTASAGDELGSTITATDVDDDGYYDIVSASSGCSCGGTNRGGIGVMFGAASMPASGAFATQGHMYTGDVNSESLAYFATGDFNRDGNGDLIIGSMYDTTTGSNSGSVYVIYGPKASFPASGNASAAEDVEIRGNAANRRFGVFVSAFDVDGDGSDDIVSSSQTIDTGPGANSGAIYVVYGSATPAATINVGGAGTVMITGDRAGDRVGSIALIAGSTHGFTDMDGDGKLDFSMTNSAASDGSNANAGSTYYIPNASLGIGAISALGYRLDGFAANQYQMMIGYNLDSDANYEFLGSETGYDHGGGTNNGRMFVVDNTQLATGALNAVGRNYIGPVDNFDLCDQTIGLGDFDGDGINDHYCESKDADGTYSKSGGIIIIRGGGSWPASGQISKTEKGKFLYFEGQFANHYLGDSISVGDFNGDGIDDIALGNDHASKDHGSQQIIFGNSDYAKIVMKEVFAESDEVATSYSGEATYRDITGDGVLDMIQSDSSTNYGGKTGNGVFYFIDGRYLGEL